MQGVSVTGEAPTLNGGGREEQWPLKQSLSSSLCRESHWKCLLLSLLMYGCVGLLGWCFLSSAALLAHDERGDGPCAGGYVYIPLAFLAMLYMVYLGECWLCWSRTAALAEVEISAVYERVQRLQRAAPCVWWKAVSYHYARRTRQVTRYRNGDAYTAAQVYHERVNTHSASSEFDFARHGVRDVSKELLGLLEHPVTRLRFTKRFGFASACAEAAYLTQRARFFADNEGLDDYMEAREGMRLKDTEFLEHMLAFPDPARRPWFSRRHIFWLASVLLLSWPLRVAAEYRTAYVHYHVEKLFGESGEDNGENEAGEGCSSRYCTISRINTVDMTELEWHISCNQQVVPSYSEAMLMNLDSIRRTPPPLPTVMHNPGYFLQSCTRCRHSASSLSLPSRTRGSVAAGTALWAGGIERRGQLAMSRSGFSLGRACLFHSWSFGGGVRGRGEEAGGGFLGLGAHQNEERRAVLDEDGAEEEQGEVVDERREGDRNRPPTYRDALFFPVLIVHGDENCHGGGAL